MALQGRPAGKKEAAEGRMPRMAPQGRPAGKTCSGRHEGREWLLRDAPPLTEVRQTAEIL